jgi:calcium-dependent protein kinase
MAPEILDGKQFAASADVWSLGVLLYIFLSGYMPYTAKSQQELKDKIATHKLVFNHKEFDSVSNEAKDLITKIL